jgi:hypothetical protein
MTTRVVRDGWKWALLVLLAGCGAPATQAVNKDEDQIRQVFKVFQEAITARDGDKLWGLLGPDSQADAEEEAKKVRESYDKAAAEDKTKQEAAFGLSAAELKDLKGAGFLKSKRFCGKYHEVPQSKIDKVTVQGDNATLNYLEEDGDKEKFALVRKSGQWKLVVPMPKAN